MTPVSYRLPHFFDGSFSTTLLVTPENSKEILSYLENAKDMSHLAGTVSLVVAFCYYSLAAQAKEQKEIEEQSTCTNKRLTTLPRSETPNYNTAYRMAFRRGAELFATEEQRTSKNETLIRLLQSDVAGYTTAYRISFLLGAVLLVFSTWNKFTAYQIPKQAVTVVKIPLTQLLRDYFFPGVASLTHKR